MTRRAIVAMSGGVDSSVAAALMVEEGWEVLGVTMLLLSGAGDQPASVRDARSVCARLGIGHQVIDFSELFGRRVIGPFRDGYLRGRTPNPCVECNRHLKFGALLEAAGSLGGDCLATGHYARQEGGRLMMGRDRAKDQSYFLHMLTADQLRRVRFPLGSWTKAEVRAEARRRALPTADRPQSQEICFVPDDDYRGFVARETGPARGKAFAEGPIVDARGNVLGTHEGLACYTIGQRKGLRLRRNDRPHFVVEKRAGTNTLVVGPSEDLSKSVLAVEDVGWVRGKPRLPKRALVRIRYRHVPAPAELVPASGGIEARFDESQRAPAPGQAAVFYDGEEVLGGGTIVDAGNARVRERRVMEEAT